MVIDIQEDYKTDLIRRMIQFLPIDKARAFLTQYGKERILNGLDFCEKELKINNETIKNPVAFFKKAVDEGWVLPQVMNQRFDKRTEYNQSEQTDNLEVDIQSLDEAETIKSFRLELLKNMGEAVYKNWIHPLKFKQDDKVFMVIAINALTRDWVENHYRQDMLRVAKKSLGDPELTVEITLINEKSRAPA
jgi:hypothetical protein